MSDCLHPFSYCTVLHVNTFQIVLLYICMYNELSISYLYSCTWLKAGWHLTCRVGACWTVFVVRRSTANTTFSCNHSVSSFVLQKCLENQQRDTSATENDGPQNSKQSEVKHRRGGAAAGKQRYKKGKS